MSALVQVIIEIIAIVLGVIWLGVNIYQFYPLAAYSVRRYIPGTDTDRPTDESEQAEDDELRKRTPDGGLMKYAPIDLFVPAYHEADVIENAISSIRSVDYPQELVRLNILVEPDDEDTRGALSELASEYEFREIVVPSMYPGHSNKPRAMNYAFEITDAPLIGVVDAENIVSPGLLRKAYTSLVVNGHDYAQGRVDMANENDGWKNTMFRGEYSYWYRFFIPSFKYVGYPIPLSGTTVFFRREVLQEVSEKRTGRYGVPWSDSERAWITENDFDGFIPWDPTNVTEDFELGQFLWYEGYEFDIIDSVTIEASPYSVSGWISQRTRWQKGKLYTFFQYLRTPPSGGRSRIHLYGQSAMPHLGPLNVIGILVLAVLGAFVGYPQHPVTVTMLWLSASFAFVVSGLHAYGYRQVSDAKPSTRRFRSLSTFLTAPAYWLLQWWADIRALKQIYMRQLHWEKTSHYGSNTDLNELYTSFDLGEFLSNRFSVDWTRAAILGIILMFAFVLRLYQLSKASLWMDELFSVALRAQLPISEVVDLTQEDHPPLYYAVLHYWLQFMGTSTFAIRLLSVLFGVLSILAIYLVGRRLFGTKVGMYSAVFMAISSMHLNYSRDARMYAMFMCFGFFSLYYFIRMLDGDRSVRTTVGYTLMTTLMVYTHLYALFAVLAQNIYAVTIFPRTDSRNSMSLSEWIPIQILLGILTFPWLWSLVERFIIIEQKGTLGVISWISEPTAKSLIDTGLTYSGYLINYPYVGHILLTLYLSAVLFALFTYCVWLSVLDYRIEGVNNSNISESEHLRRNYLLLLWIAVPIFVPFVMSYLIAPFYVVRSTVLAFGGVLVLAANGLTKIRNDHIRLALTAVLLLGTFTTTVAYYDVNTEENWQGIGTTIDAHAQTGDMVVLHPDWIDGFLDYYSDRQDITRLGFPDGHAKISNHDLRMLRASMCGHERVWVIFAPNYGSQKTLNTIDDSYTQKYHQSFGRIDVYRFHRVDNSGCNAKSRGQPDDRTIGRWN